MLEQQKYRKQRMSHLETQLNQIDPLSPTWQHYQQLRLSRLQQQRQRMQNMKQVIQKYTQIINEMENKNAMLMNQNQNILKQNHKLKLQNRELQYQIEELKMEIGKEGQAREGLEIVIQRMKQEIEGRSGNGVYSYQYEYQTLQELYEGLKNEYYLVTKQNLELKDTIKQKSRIHTFNPQQSTTNRQKTLQIQTSLSSHNLQTMDHQRQKTKRLKQEIKKMQILIDKFKQTEAQQQNLIQLLKKSNNRTCGCHYGSNVPKSSSKILSINFGEDGKNKQ